MCLKTGLKILCKLDVKPIETSRGQESVFLVTIKPTQKTTTTVHERFLDGMREIYFKVGLDGYIHQMSPAVLKIMGYESLNEIIGTKLFKDLPLKANSLQETKLWQALLTKGGKICRYEITLPKSDGSKALLESNVQFYYSDQFKIEGVEGFATDVTSNRELIAELKSTLNLTKSLLQALPNPIMYKNKKLVFEGCNQAFSDLTGISQEDIRGKKAKEIWSNEFAIIAEQKELETLKTGDFQVFEGYITDAKKNRIAVIMITACYPGPKGKPAGVISSFLDITARKTIELAIKKHEEGLSKENASLRRIINPHLRKTVMVGSSQSVMGLYNQIAQAAKTNMPVLIEGESGTGKELVAMEIHRNSDRSKKDVIAVNCSAIPHELTESIFFGHTKGAFTGALNNSKGYIRAADGGTLFLDEINSIPLEKQAKLLRVLESGEVTPVGGSIPAKSDFRLISASNQDLEELVKQGSIRTDFFYRLKVLSIKVPPLRERKEDIPMLAYHFLNQFKQEHPEVYSSDKKFISRELFNKLTEYDFPGNIRELKNVLFQFFATGNLVLSPFPEKKTLVPQKAETAGRPLDLEFSQDGSLKEVMSDVEKRLILQLLDRYRYNRTQVAKHLLIGRKTLYNKMKYHGIDYDN